MFVLAGLEVVSAFVGHGLVATGASQAKKVSGYRDENLRGNDIAILRTRSELMERSVALTTNQNVRQLEGRRHNRREYSGSPLSGPPRWKVRNTHQWL